MSKTTFFLLALSLALAGASSLTQDASAQGLFTVNSTDGDDPDVNPGDGICSTGQLNRVAATECTLRAAIEEANATNSADSIHFDIPASDSGCSAGVCTIAPDSAYIEMTRPVVVDGRTQPGTDCSTWDLRIILDGAAVSGNGLRFRSTQASVFGMSVHSFSGSGLEFSITSDQIVQCNILGTDPAGSGGLGNQVGVYLAGNVSSLVGTDGDGSNDLAEGNVISGNSFTGIRLQVATGATLGDSNAVSGNLIGLAPDGVSPLGNGIGIFLESGGIYLAEDNLIGGTLPQQANTIAYNTGDGVQVSGLRNRILGNSMFANGDLGIDLDGNGPDTNDPDDPDSGANNFQNHPELIYAAIRNGRLNVAYRVDSDPANASYPFRIEFFKTDADGEEGEELLGDTTYTLANYNTGCASAPCTILQEISVAGLTAGDMIVATATDADGNTSEFGNAILVEGQITVNSTGDGSDSSPGDGFCATGASIPGLAAECTFRAAIQEANAAAGADSIGFMILPSTDPGCDASGASCTIEPTSVLPDISEPVFIDGTTMPASSCGTLFSGRVLRVEISGTNLVSGSGIRLVGGSNGSIVRGLVINGFPSHGIELSGSVGSSIQCNYVGTDLLGENAEPNGGLGVILSLSSSSNDNIIGTDGDGVADSTEGNLISGNGGWGIGINTSNSGNTIAGNRIGVDRTGGSSIPNGTTSGGGIAVLDQDNTVGTNGDGVSDEIEGNIVSGNIGDGIWLSFAAASGNTIAGNRIGLGITDTDTLGNSSAGVSLQNSAGSNRIGTEQSSPNPIDANEIAFNLGPGVFIGSGTQNSVLGNSIYENGTFGIDLGSSGQDPIDPADPDAGANNLQNPPEVVLASRGSLLVTYFVDSDTVNSAYPLHIEFFNADADSVEGREFLATAEYTASDWSGCGSPPCVAAFGMAISVPLSDVIVATATDAQGNTSEFSSAVEISELVAGINSTRDTTDLNPGDGLCFTGSTNSEGQLECTLRAAIEEANATAGPDTLLFAIPAASDPGCNPGTGECTIQPTSSLPTISEQVFIDGESQSAATCGSGFASRDLKIVIDGSAIASSANGMTLGAGSSRSRINGLVIANFKGYGLRVQSDSSLVTCNFIGTTASGLAAAGNDVGGIFTVSPTSGHTIGTDGDGLGDDAEGNLISGNGQMGIFVEQGERSVIAGNFIGVDRTLSGVLPNGIGIRMDGTLSRIGTNGDGVSDRLEANVIGGNLLAGVYLNDATTDTVAGNFIGTDTTGTLMLGNGGRGIAVTFNFAVPTNHLIGTNSNAPSDSVLANVIAFNQGDGIEVFGGTETTIRRNVIFSNDSLGIDLDPNGVNTNDPLDPDEGANRLQNTPVLEFAISDGPLLIGYSVDVDPGNATYPLEIDFYLSDTDGQEGRTWLGRASYLSSDYDGCGSPPCPGIQIYPSSQASIGERLVATATDADGNTSEFSAPVKVSLVFCAVEISVRAFLEGPYDAISDKMRTTLRDAEVVPLSQPFGSPEYADTPLYSASELTLPSLPDSVVDWVLVELRSDDTTRTAQSPALLTENGYVVSPGENTYCHEEEGDGLQYITVYARNHLGIMSSQQIDLDAPSPSWDFTADSANAFGADAMKELEPGVWGMFGGDATIDGQVTASDFNLWLTDTKAAATGYLLADFTMDGQVTASDFNMWLQNTKVAASSKVPAIVEPPGEEF